MKQCVFILTFSCSSHRGPYSTFLLGRYTTVSLFTSHISSSHSSTIEMMGTQHTPCGHIYVHIYVHICIHTHTYACVYVNANSWQCVHHFIYSSITFLVLHSSFLLSFSSLISRNALFGYCVASSFLQQSTV